MEHNQSELLRKAIAYLKDQYGEDTIRMEVTADGVDHGNGVFEVDCTVSIGGEHSDWTKWFSFKNGSVTGMRWKAH